MPRLIRKGSHKSPEIPEAGFNSSELAIHSDTYVSEYGRGKVRDTLALYPDWSKPKHYFVYGREANGHGGEVYVRATAGDLHDFAQWIIDNIPTPDEPI